MARININLKEKIYQPKKYQKEVYKIWEPYLRIEKYKNRKKKFISLMAPPNITGTLHMGHALENTLIDVLIRFYRMKNYLVVWIPGTDHAGIATQNVVEKELKKQGLTRKDLGRKRFLKKVWQWREKYGHLILEQFKALGITPDWSRTKFTLDNYYVQMVENAFIKYYRDGLIYRALRPINWCPRCETSLSDLEIEWESKPGNLYYIRYPLKNSKKWIIIATTRPETMLADTAIAVNPEDKRYKKYIKKTALLPLVGRELKIIADKRVDPNFGTGALKITPAHSLIDYEIGIRHNLEMIQVINFQGEMTNQAGEFQGLDYLKAREKILEKLKEQNYLVKVETFQHNLPYCYRCHTEIQVVPSKEWFLKMDKLAELAKQAIKSKKIELIPEKFKKPYFEWLDNIRDWCISRKIWWGQTIPVWYSQCDNELFKVQRQKPKAKCPLCKKNCWQKTEEVFDTWFSSAIWPFAILYTKKEKQFYPADLVSSARDILHLWITRMIFSGLYFKNQIPFRKIFIHPTVLTKEGKRMSKSLGTGVDPIDLIEKYGTDAVRFGLMWQTMRQQDIRFDEENIKTGQKFANKIWNAFRFYLLNKGKIKNLPKLTQADKKILKELEKTKKQIAKNLEKFEFGFALRILYKFFWHQLCDIYLECAKTPGKVNHKTLKFVLEESLKLISLFMPFIAEVLWRALGNQKPIMIQKIR